MKTSFLISFVDFKKMLAEAKRLVPTAMSSVVKIVVQPNDVEFSFAGIDRTVLAKTENYCDALVPFSILYSLSRTIKSSELLISLRDGEIRANSTIIGVKSIKVQSLFSNSEIPLSINHNKADVLRLRQILSVNKLDELHLHEHVVKTESDLEEMLLSVYPKLQPYGIIFSEFSEWIRHRIYNT